MANYDLSDLGATPAQSGGSYDLSDIGGTPQVAAPTQNGPSGYAADSGTVTPTVNAARALLTNQPTQNFGETFLRGLPASIGSILGAGAGVTSGIAVGPLAVVASPAAAVAGSAIGAASGESARQGLAQGYSLLTGQPFTPPQQALGDMAVQGALGAAGEGIGQGLGALRKPAINIGASLMRNAAAIPETAGRAALSDLSLLGRAPSDDAVSSLYDSFHDASGTVSRKATIAESGDPFDTVARSMSDMRDASAKLQAGTLTTQEAVNASQAGRVIRDQKMSGNEMAREVSDTANELKGQFDNFIQQGIGPRTEIQNIPVAQQIVPETTPIASSIVPKSDIFQSGTTLVPGSVDVPTQGTKDITPDVKRVIGLVNQARGNGLLPKAIMTDSERSIYDQFSPAIESAAEHNIPIESLLTSSERSIPVSGSTQMPVLQQGDPIYAGANKYEFGGTISKTEYKPGAMITGDVPVQVPAKPGFPEWQSARQAAWENNVAGEFSSAFPLNKNGSSNQLRGALAIGGIAGSLGEAGLSLALGHPGAAAVGVAGAVATPFIQSPMAYGALIRAANNLSPIAKAAAMGFKFAPGSLGAWYNSPGISTP